MSRHFVAFFIALGVAAPAAEPPGQDNGGILNGPLMQGGHRAQGEGNRESLKLAIEDLMATYRDRYPKGESFLKRLEAIEDESASKALLDSLSKLKGRLLAGAVNSLGVRREVKAVAPLQQLATDPSSEVRTEAIASLGMIATPEVVPTLKSGLKTGPGLRTAIGHASLIAVGHMRADGEDEAAADLLKAIVAAFADGPIHDAAKRL